MNEYDIAYPITKPSPLDQLTISPIENEEAREILWKHGCTIEECSQKCIIHFPEGTTKTEIFLRHTHPRYRITLPDGYELREIYDRYQKISILFYRSNLVLNEDDYYE
ncbi:MAG TPA: hypothetical protein VNG51_13440 [Ktedonobacteraceae bacterium]|nr:hypothetical protein [Ktedonobacteraceae bacterium]